VLPAFAGFLLGLLFDSEDGGNMSGFLQTTQPYNRDNHTLQKYCCFVQLNERNVSHGLLLLIIINFLVWISIP
jgi:hypothetical protein